MLDFQLFKHEKYLSRFIGIFDKIDSETNGVINENQFEALIKEMNLGISEVDIKQLIKRIDPYHNQKITFSECVGLLTYEALDSNRSTETMMEMFNSRKSFS